MTDYFNIELESEALRGVSSLALAHIGDAVYELMVRSYLCISGGVTAGTLHAGAVKYVAAPAQAAAVRKIAGLLTPEETAVYKRGRNTRVNSVPQNATMADYHAATGLEALFGFLYLTGKTERLNELFAAVMEDE